MTDILRTNTDERCIADSAIECLALGLSTLPAIRKEKRPAVSWKEYQHRLPTAQEWQRWSGYDGLCIICGAVSGNLFMLDFDQRAKAYLDWAAKVSPDSLARCVIERSQRGGLHVIARSESPVGKNEKLALDANGAVLIETRAEGGLFLCAPTPGYELTQGDFKSIPVLTAGEVNVLIDAARSLNEKAAKKKPTPSSPIYTPVLRTSHDRADAIERCRNHVDQMPPCVAGQGGDSQLYNVCCVIFHDFALDEADGWGILTEFNARCQPPWDESRLRYKMSEAMKLNVWQPITLHKRRDCIGDFPTDSLPHWLATWVESKANNLQVSAAMPAMLALGTLSGCLAKRFRVEARYDWQEPVNIYVCTLMPPANRKSAVLGAAIRPIVALDKKMTADGIEERNKVLAEREQIERNNKLAKKKSKREPNPEATDKVNETVEVLDGAAKPLPPVPPIPQLKCDDITEEALAVALVENGNRIISTSAEAVTAFGTILGKYGRGIARSALYLKGHDLNDGHRVDRRSSNPIILDDDFSLTCIYTGQLAALEEESRKNPHLKSSGLFARFLWIVPPSKVGYRKTGSGHLIIGEVDDEAYSNRIRDLAKAMRPEAEPVILRLDEAARVRFEEWEAEIEVMLRERGRLGIDNALAEWGGKLAGATLRLAGIIYCADRILDIYAVTAHAPIGCEVVQRAITIAEHLIGHAEAFFVGVLEGSGGRSDAHHLAQWIVRTKSERFTKCQAQQQCRSRFPNAADIVPAIAELERHHCIRQIPDVPQDGAGRPKSPEFEVNPAMFQTASASEMGIDTTETPPPTDNFSNC